MHWIEWDYRLLYNNNMSLWITIIIKAYLMLKKLTNLVGIQLCTCTIYWAIIDKFVTDIHKIIIIFIPYVWASIVLFLCYVNYDFLLHCLLDSRLYWGFRKTKRALSEPPAIMKTAIPIQANARFITFLLTTLPLQFQFLGYWMSGITKTLRQSGFIYSLALLDVWAGEM